MNIVAFIKQVPDTNDVKWTQNNNIDRTKMDSIINPVDKEVLEAALCLKDKYNARTIAITMGPEKSVSILKEAIAMGFDEAFLLCDSKFAASDTCATSRVLAAAIKEKLPSTNLILFGQNAIDGETSQTGPSTAARLNLPFISNVKEIKNIQNGIVNVFCETETAKSIYDINLPCVLIIKDYISTPRLPKIEGYIRSQEYTYKTFNLAELKLKETEAGLKGSPTSVVYIYRNDDKRNCNFIYHNNDMDYTNVISAIKETMEN